MASYRLSDKADEDLSWLYEYQCPRVARYPAREGPVPHTFQGMQQPQGDDLPGPEVGFGVCGDGAQLLIDLVEQRRDQIHCGHGPLLSSPGCRFSPSLVEVHARKTR